VLRRRHHSPAGSKSSTTSSCISPEQMGEVLKATAQSVNIKERLDYSCAVFDAEGGLVANAPHMPVSSGLHGRKRARRHRCTARADAPGRFLAAE